LDRDKNHEVILSPTVQTWYDSLTPYNSDPNRISISNQRDLVAPVISDVSNSAFTQSTTLDVTFTINENGYAIAGDLSVNAANGQGMQVDVT
jgi:hypothetical protein